MGKGRYRIRFARNALAWTVRRNQRVRPGRRWRYSRLRSREHGRKTGQSPVAAPDRDHASPQL